MNTEPLTRRELFAAMALQGLLASADDLRDDDISISDTVMDALAYADSLIKQLAKSPGIETGKPGDNITPHG